MTDRPTISTIIGLAFTLFGVLALITVAAAAEQGVLSVNPPVLLLPLGIGLLRNSERSRKLTAIFFAAMALASVLAATSVPFTRWGMNYHFNERAGFLTGGPLAAALIASSIFFLFLYLGMTSTKVIHFYRFASKQSAT